MDKTIKINLGGTLFQTDEEAYNLLRRYLQEIDTRLKNVPGGAETIEDIEFRISEIFQSQKGTAGIISKENVESMIALLGKPEDFEISDDQVEERPKFSRSGKRKKMYRNPDDRIIGGVCGGMGIYLNIEPVWVRVLFVIFALCGGAGLFVYLALWIALPSAVTETMKREMLGDASFNSESVKPQDDRPSFYNGSQSAQNSGSSRLGNALNEIFRAMGRLFYIAFRIIAILLGISIVLTGFVSLVAIIMVFVFKYPGYFSNDAVNINLNYFTDFLNYVVSPSVAPWILVLAFAVILLPLLAMIYWGVKMIFWFRARDLVFALAGLVIWVMSIAALSIILFSEGISFSETAKTGSEELLGKSPQNLYILTGHKVSELNYDKEITFSDEGYNVYLRDAGKGLFISPVLKINSSNDEFLKINIRKRSTGRNRPEATKKAEGLMYEFRLTGDTLFLDDYFTVPTDRKWSFDNVGINLYIPSGTIIHFDANSNKLFHHEDHDYSGCDSENENDSFSTGTKSLTWIMTDNGLVEKSDQAGNNK